MRATLGVLAVLGLVTLVAVSGCGGSDSAGVPDTGSGAANTDTLPAAAAPGGVYRVGVEESFNFTDGFDPTGEYSLDAFSLYSSLLVRGLLGYRHVAGVAGSELVPDLAVGEPEVSTDGLTWRFRLKSGIRFGPPVNREITSKDFVTAFERIGTPSIGAQYAFYYDVIEGMTAFAKGKADTITGIETPDDRTIVFRLTRPTGDFGYRLALPAAGPIPDEVARCFTEPGEYGRFVIASGPYMIEGSDALDTTSCKTMKAISGFDPESSLSLVRNPEYDPATDDPEARQNLPDGFLLTIDSNGADIFAKLEAGELEGEWASAPPTVLKQYSQSGDLQDRLKVNDADAIAFVFLNLTQPPFDDIHVRKAVNLAMDKRGLQLAWGGELAGAIATHVFPDSITGDENVGFDPYPSPDSAGDLDAAKAEMAKSAYDTDGDGVCDADVCKAVLDVSVSAGTPHRMAPVVEQSLAKVGIEVKTREFGDPFTILQTPSKDVPMSHLPTWGKDFPNASTFAVLFDGDRIIPEGNVNLSLVGLTPAIAKTVGVTGTVTGIPSVASQLDRCMPLVGPEQTSCWAELDRTLMDDVVPWIPYLARANVDVLGPAVTQYSYDQFSTQTGYAHVAVDPSKQQGS